MYLVDNEIIMIDYEDRNSEKDMSIRGKVKINGAEYFIWALLFDEKSDYGINRGRISKLTIRSEDFSKYYKNGVIFDYDRGSWNTFVPISHVLSQVIKSLESQPKKF